MLKDKKILLGVSGGIAVYKAIDLASHLVKAGAIVRTIMTEHAMEFVKPINFAAITHQPVYWNQWDIAEPIAHITLADWADIVVIAPATANLVAKAAHGIADDLLTSTLLAVTSPVLCVPSMNVNMYANSIMQANLKSLEDHGYFCLEPDKGSLACGYEGKGRFPDPKEIMYAIETYLYHKQDLLNKKILITAGGSVEKIDPMRSIANMSSGKMGLALARAAWLRGAEVTFIHSLITEVVPYYLYPIKAITANDMYESVTRYASSQDIVIMAAAVADYTITKPATHKIKKTKSMEISLTCTKDILMELSKKPKPNLKIIGFAAESENLEEYAKEKLKNKHLDMIVANYIEVSGSDDTQVIILSSNSKKTSSGSKFQVAHEILDFLING